MPENITVEHFRSERARQKTEGSSYDEPPIGSYAWQWKTAPGWVREQIVRGILQKKEAA